MKIRKILALIIAAALMLTATPIVSAAARTAVWNGSAKLKSSVMYTADKNITVTKAITVPKTSTLTISKNNFAYIGKNGSLTVNGTLDVKGTLSIGVFSSVVINGKLNVSSSGRIVGSGRISFSENAKIKGESRIECAVGSSSDDEFLRANGREITDGLGNPVQLKGIAMTSGLWDDFELGYKTENLKESYNEMSKMGFNSTRLCFGYDLFEDDDNPYVYKQSGWDFLDENIAYAKRYGIYLVLNIHRPQGGYQSQGNGMDLWLVRENQKRLIALWTAIAEHVKDEPIVVGFGIVNEPYAPKLDTEEKTVAQWKTLSQEITDSIRTVDKRHMIFLEGLMACKNVGSNNSDWAFENKYKGMFTIDDDNVAYEFHCYEPFDFTHQNFDWAGWGGQIAFYPVEKKSYTYIEWITAAGGGSADKSNADWQYTVSNKFRVEDTRITMGGTSLTAHNLGANGKVLFDDIRIDEFDEKGLFVRTVYESDYSEKPNKLSCWSQDNSASADFVKYDGHNGPGCIEISGATNLCTVSTSEEFEVKQGYYYQISGYVKCVNVSKDAYIAADIGFSQYDAELVNYNKDCIYEQIEYILDFSKEFNVPLYLGEFGCNNESITENRGGEQWVTDVLSICSENNISYDYWGLRGSFGIYQDSGRFPLNMCKGLYDLFVAHFGTGISELKTKSNEKIANASGDWDDPIIWDGTTELTDGLSYTLSKSITKSSLHIPSWTTLNILGGQTLTVDKLNVDGTINNDGAIRVNGYLTMNGYICNNGTITGSSSDNPSDIHITNRWFSPHRFDEYNDLYLSWGDISDVSEFKKINNLRRVELAYNDISDISSFAGQSSELYYLNVEHNDIKTASPLSALYKLETLKISGNKLTSLLPFKNLTNLKYLDAGQNSVSKLSPLKNLTSLEYLSLSECKIYDSVKYLNGLTKLKTLRLGANYISNISALSSLQALEALELQDNEISDLSPLKSLKTLNELSLQGNEIKSLSALQNLKNLTYLNLNCNEIDSVKYLKKLTNLTELRLNYNNIKDITPLKSLKKLTSLYLYGNPLTQQQIDELQKALPGCTIFYA